MVKLAKMHFQGIISAEKDKKGIFSTKIRDLDNDASESGYYCHFQRASERPDITWDCIKPLYQIPPFASQ